jgi:LysR family hydrogen peroxide-inducible transcriptional activator
MQKKINFSLTQLEYVMAVFKHGHFAKAAESCHITQPTLSMQIQKLEEEMGAIIFDRSKKPILLTDLGLKIIEQIQTTLFEAKKIEEIINTGLSGKLTGEIKLGVIPTITPYILPKLLGVIEKQYPGIKLNVQELQTHRIIEALGNDEIDVGLLATPLKINNIFEFPLYYETFSLLCRKDHELSKQKKVHHKDLIEDDLWLLEEGHCLRNQVLDVCSFKKNKKKVKKFNFESGNLETLKNLVELYGGHTLLPRLATDKIASNTKLIEFERPIPAREIGLVYRRQHYKNDLIEALGECILLAIPEIVRKIRPKDLNVLPIE